MPGSDVYKLNEVQLKCWPGGGRRACSSARRATTRNEQCTDSGDIKSENLHGGQDSRAKANRMLLYMTKKQDKTASPGTQVPVPGNSTTLVFK